jgi:hypothetical protein
MVLGSARHAKVECERATQSAKATTGVCTPNAASHDDLAVVGNPAGIGEADVVVAVDIALLSAL